VINLRHVKQFLIIFLLFSTLKSDTDTDVKHMIVYFSGKTVIGLIDSINFGGVYYKEENSSFQEYIPLWKVFYIYNDFDRVFHYSWSFYENMRRINMSSGTIFTIHNDTIKYSQIKVNNNMIRPELYVIKEKEHTELIPLLHVEKIITDFSIMEFSVERGFRLSSTVFLTSLLFDMRIKDFLPKMEYLGLKKTGVTYESLVHFVPLATFSTMMYDYITDKRTFYFTPILSDKKFGRNMYVFSIRNIFSTFTKNILWRAEKIPAAGKAFRWIRLKF